MKLLLTLLLSFITAISFAQVDKSKHALLWEITGNDLDKPSYIFGTMHVQDERAHEFTDSTLLCLDATDAFAMEINIDSIIYDILEIYLNGDTTNVLKGMLSPEAYDRLNKKIIKQTGKSLDEMDNKDPQFVEGLLIDWDEPDYTVKKDQMVDLYLMKRASEQGHRTYGLEKMEDYLGVTQSYFKLFEDESDTTEVSEGDKNLAYERLIKIYQRGDLGEVESTFVNKESQTEFDIEMLDNRNKKMVLGLMRLMKSQTVFCAVGTAHLPGKEGMLEELKRQGYKVRKVKADFEGYANTYEKTVTKLWQTFESKTHLYKVKAPGEALSLKDQVKEIGPNSLAHLNMDLLDQHVYIHMVMDLAAMIGDVAVDSIEEKFLENWTGGKGNELLKSMDVTRTGKAGKRFFTKDESGNDVIWEVFVKGKLVYVFSALKEGGMVPKDSYEAFFESIEFTEEEWQKYEFKQGAFNVAFPFEPSEKRVPVKMEYESKSGREMILKSQVCRDPLKSITYLARYSNMDEGMAVDENKAWLMATLTLMTERLGKPDVVIDSLMLQGLFAYKASYVLKQTLFEVYVFNRGNRGMILGVEHPKTGNYEKEKERFYNSLELRPLQESTFSPVAFEEGTYAMNFPGKVYRERIEMDGYPYYDKYEYAAIDSMHSGNFEMDVFFYNPYYMPTSKDSTVSNFSKKTFYSDENSSAIDTVFQGRKAVYIRTPNEKSDNIIYELLFHNGIYLFDLTVNISKELNEDIAWQFFNSFKNNNPHGKDYLIKDKKDLLFKGLEAKDTVALDHALKAMDFVELSPKDLPRIYKTLEKKISGNDERVGQVKSVLLREFQYTNDETTIAFIEKIFYKNKKNRRLQLDALNTLATFKSKRAFDLFFKLSADLPKDKTVNLVHATLFNNFLDTMSLTMNYVDPMLRLTDDPSFSFYVYDVFLRACYSDSNYVEMVKPCLPKLLAEANTIVTTNKLEEAQDSIVEFDFYSHLNKLNYLFGFFKESKEVGAYYKRVKNIPDAFLLTNIVDAMLVRNEEVETAAFEKIIENPYQWNRLLRAADYENNLDKIPAHLITQEKIVESIAARNIQDDNDVMTNFEIIDTRKHSHSGKDYKVYLFTFGVRGYTGTYVGLCSQPIDKAQIFENYFDYNTTPYEAEKKETIIADFLSNWAE